MRSDSWETELCLLSLTCSWVGEEALHSESGWVVCDVDTLQADMACKITEEEGECGDIALGPRERDQVSRADCSRLKGGGISFPISQQVASFSSPASW